MFIPWSMKLVDITWWRTGLDWAVSDPHNIGSVEEADLPATQSHPGLSTPVINGWNSAVEMDDNGKVEVLDTEVHYHWDIALYRNTELRVFVIKLGHLMLDSSCWLDNICLPAQNCAYENGNLMQKVGLSSYEYETLKFSQVLFYLMCGWPCVVIRCG